MMEILNLVIAFPVIPNDEGSLVKNFLEQLQDVPVFKSNQARIISQDHPIPMKQSDPNFEKEEWSKFLENQVLHDKLEQLATELINKPTTNLDIFEKRRTLSETMHQQISI